MTDLVLVFLLPFVSLAAFTAWRYMFSRSTRSKHDGEEKGLPKTDEKNPYQDIEPLPDFDWRTTEPIQNCPLKAKYHLTMGIFY